MINPDKTSETWGLPCTRHYCQWVAVRVNNQHFLTDPNATSLWYKLFCHLRVVFTLCDLLRSAVFSGINFPNCIEETAHLAQEVFNVTTIPIFQKQRCYISREKKNLNTICIAVRTGSAETLSWFQLWAAVCAATLLLSQLLNCGPGGPPPWL